MSVYQKYKANRVWDIDFRTGSFKDRSGNVVMSYANTPKLGKNGMDGRNNAFVGGTPTGSITSFTISFQIDFMGKLSGSERIMNSGWAGIYFVSNRSPFVFEATGITYVSSLAIWQKKGLHTVTLTDSGGLLTCYYDGLAIETLAHVAGTHNLAYTNINTNTAAQGVNGYYKYFLWYNVALSATEVAQLTSELNQIPDQRPFSQAIAKGSGTGEIYFKGDLGVVASETATTSGHLENSGCKVLSGSFKMTTEKNNGRIEKVIVCVSTGSFYVTQAVAALTGWRRYVNTGAGYVAVVTDLATARTIPLNTGDKLIWASENHSRSLYQMA